MRLKNEDVFGIFQVWHKKGRDDAIVSHFKN